jgi:hypothetical protein
MAAPQIFEIDFVDEKVVKQNVGSVDYENTNAKSLIVNVTDQYYSSVKDVTCVVYYDTYKNASNTDASGIARLYHSVGHSNRIVIKKIGYVTISRDLTTVENNNSDLSLSLVMQRTDTPRLSNNNRLIVLSETNKPSRYRKGQSWYFNLKNADVVVDGSNRVSRVNDYHNTAFNLANPTIDEQPTLTSEGLVFDDVNDFLRLEPNNFSLASTDFTIAFWVKTRTSAPISDARIVALSDNNIINIATCSFKNGATNVLIFANGATTYESQLIDGFNHVAITFFSFDNSISYYVNGKIIGNNINVVSPFNFASCTLMLGNNTSPSIGSILKDIIIAKYALFNVVGVSIGQQAFAPQLREKEKWSGGQFADLNVVDKSKVKICLHSRTALNKSGNTVTSWVDTLTSKTYTVSNGTVTNDATKNGIVMSSASLLSSGTVNIDMSKLDLSFWYYQTATSGGIIYLYSNATNNFTMKNTATGFDVSVNGTVKATITNPLNAWVHVRVLLVNGSLRVFANGLLASSVASVQSNNFSCTPRIGYLTTAYLSGRIDALLIHDDLPFDPFSNKEMLVGRWYFTPQTRNSL